MTLLEKKLVDFNDNFSFDITLEVLNEKFEELAKYFLYSGYIQVNDSYRIELVSVEFYFHAEEKNDSTCKYFQDPIVYHRNGRFGLTDVPYLPMMSLNPHPSGFDITFENAKLKYRASALIREYKVMDLLGNIVSLDEQHKACDDRSTFLYYYLCGFAIGENINGKRIEWKDNDGVSEEFIKNCTVVSSPRVNVFELGEVVSTDPTKLVLVFKDGRKMKDGSRRERERDTRPWKFSRSK